MTVVCKVNCPYNDRGFCVRGITAIDEMGMCEVWWQKGQRRANSEVEQNAPLYREDLVILNVQKVEDVEDGLQYSIRNDGAYGSDDKRNSENSKQFREDGDKSAGTRGNETKIGKDGAND